MSYSSVHFEPWVGENFWNGGIFGKSILILGESHYGTDEGSFMTRDLIGDQCNSRYMMKPYTPFEKALVGHNTDKYDRKTIWESVAFYNYIQEVLYDADSVPEQYQWNDAEDAFFEVLNELQPDIVFVWGRRLWNHLPYTDYTYTGSNSWNGTSYSTGIYELDDGIVIPVYEVRHPGRRYDYCSQNSYMNAYIL